MFFDWLFGRSRTRKRRPPKKTLATVLNRTSDESDCCMRPKLNGGFGNWLYISVEVALLVATRDCALVLPEILGHWFEFPSYVALDDSRMCGEIRNMQRASGNAHTRRRVTAAMDFSTFDDARAHVFRELFSHPKPTLTNASFATVVHLRTYSDVRCSTYSDLRSCNRACVRPEAIACIVQNSLPPVLILSDAAHVSATLKAAFAAEGIEKVYEEDAVVPNAQNHSASSYESAAAAATLWAAFFQAKHVRIGSSISTFSKSALLAGHRRRKSDPSIDFVVDTRCVKGHESDGELFSCHRASVRRDLV